MTLVVIVFLIGYAVGIAVTISWMWWRAWRG